MNPTSCAPSVGVIGLATAPQRHTAQHNTTASHQLGSCHATTVPGPIPRSASAPRHSRGAGAEIVDREARVAVDDGERVAAHRRQAIEQRFVGPDALRAPLRPEVGGRRMRAVHCAP